MHFFRLPISPNMEIFGCYKASTPADSAWIGSAAQDVRAHESSSHRWSSLHQSWCQQSVPWQRLTTDIWHKIFKYTVVLTINSYIPSDITLYNSYIPLYTIWYNIIYHYITEYTLCDMFFLVIGLTWEFNHFLHGDVTVNKWDWPSIYDGFMLVYDYKIDTGYAVERICKQTFRKLGVALFFVF